MKSSMMTRLIHFSTFHVYGGIRANYREDDLPSPQSPYGKVHLELESQLASRTVGMPVSVVRASNLVGKPAHLHLGPQASLLLLDLCNQASRGRIALKNDGYSYRDFLSFDNAFTALDLIASQSESLFQIINLASGNCMQIRDIVDIIFQNRKSVNLPLEVEFGSGTDAYRSPFSIDISKLEKMGWIIQNDMPKVVDNLSRFFLDN